MYAQHILSHVYNSNIAHGNGLYHMSHVTQVSIAVQGGEDASDVFCVFLRIPSLEKKLLPKSDVSDVGFRQIRHLRRLI